MKTLLTGITGLVGHAIAARLVAAGHRVRAVVRDVDRAALTAPEGVELVAGDVLDPDSLARAADGRELAFHAAGMPEQFTTDPTVFDRVNRQGTANVMRAALDARIARVVHTSTIDVFAAERGGTLVETRLDSNPKPTAYGRSKVDSEREAEAARAEGLQVVFVNPGGVYGPSPSKVAMNRGLLELLHGRVPVLPPGGLSLVLTTSLANAHLRAAEVGRDGERYLVADAYATLRDLAGLLAAAGGPRRIPPSGPEWVVRPFAGLSGWWAARFGVAPLVSPTELEFLLWEARVDTRKAQDELGFEPVPLEVGIAATLEDFAARGWWAPVR